MCFRQIFKEILKGEHFSSRYKVFIWKLIHCLCRDATYPRWDENVPASSKRNKNIWRNRYSLMISFIVPPRLFFRPGFHIICFLQRSHNGYTFNVKLFNVFERCFIFYFFIFKFLNNNMCCKMKWNCCMVPSTIWLIFSEFLIFCRLIAESKYNKMWQTWKILVILYDGNVL